MNSCDLILIALAVAVLVAGVAFGVTAQIGSGACEMRASALSTDYSWDIASGCYIEVEPNRWVPLDRL